MEFKGTKGNWKLVGNDYGYFTSVRNLDDTRKICVSRVNNQTESNANMLLISKAPEMLEMLIELIDNCCGEQECEEELIKGLGNTLYNSVFKAKQLIKQAKEL